MDRGRKETVLFPPACFSPSPPKSSSTSGTTRQKKRTTTGVLGPRVKEEDGTGGLERRRRRKRRRGRKGKDEEEEEKTATASLPRPPPPPPPQKPLKIQEFFLLLGRPSLREHGRHLRPSWRETMLRFEIQCLALSFSLS